MAEPIQFVYDGIPVTYDEGKDVWEFTLRGRDRTAPSPAKAKEFIDKPVPADKAKPFKRVPAFFRNGWGYETKFVHGEITSIAEELGGSIEVWVTTGKERRKHFLRNLFADTPANRERIEKIDALVKQATALRDQINSHREGLAAVTLAIPE